MNERDMERLIGERNIDWIYRWRNNDRQLGARDIEREVEKDNWGTMTKKRHRNRHRKIGRQWQDKGEVVEIKEANNT